MHAMPLAAAAANQGSNPPFVVAPTQFPANGWLARGGNFTGIADSPFGILSLWFYCHSLTSNFFAFRAAGANPFNCTVDTNGSLTVLCNSIGGGQVGRSGSPGDVTTGAWYNVLCSWDTNHAAGNKIFHLLLNGAPLAPNVNSGPAQSVGYTTATDWMLANLVGGGGDSNACMAEVYFNTVAYLDLSDPANVAKFYAGGRPVDLGPNGELPTGLPPTMYLNQQGPAFGTNAGTGGNLTATGILSPCASAP